MPFIILNKDIGKRILAMFYINLANICQKVTKIFKIFIKTLEKVSLGESEVYGNAQNR